jgi:hypothetical protein
MHTKNLESLIFFLFDHFMPKNYSQDNKKSIDDYVKENMQAVQAFTKNSNEEFKRFVESLGETILKKMILKYGDLRININKTTNLLKKQRKRSTKPKQEIMSKFYHMNKNTNENFDDCESFKSNRKSSMFDETNSLSACVLSSPTMSPTRFNEDNIITDIFVKNPSEAYQYDHFFELASFKHDDKVNNIYQV